MMEDLYDDLFAVGLLLVTAFSLTVVWRTFRWPRISQVILALVLACVGFLVPLLFMPMCACRSGSSVSPSLFSGGCIGLVYAFSSLGRRKKLAMLIGLMVVSSLLTEKSSDLGCAGVDGDCIGFYEMRQKSTMQSVELAIQEVEARGLADDDVPVGWIEDSLKEMAGEPVFERVRMSVDNVSIRRCWHTWFSGLHEHDFRDMGIWCPGGNLSGLVDRLELRPRP